MNSDIIQIYELNLQKNYDLLESQLTKSQIYEEEYLDSIIDSMDNLLSLTSKTTKDYIIGLTLNEQQHSNSQKYDTKIKKAEKNLKYYQKKVKEIKAKHKKNQLKDKEIIPKYNKDDMIQSIENVSFNKMNHAIRVSTQIENISGNILVDLSGQSNIMKNGIRKVGDMNEVLDSSKNYINKMIDRENYDKKVILIVGFFLFMITLFVFLFKIYQKLQK